MTLTFMMLIGVSIAAAHAISRCVAASGPVQLPNHRSCHKRPTPQSGGLGVLAGVGIGMLLLGLFQPTALGLTATDLMSMTSILVFLTLLAGIGFIDDICELAPGAKLAGLLTLSVALAAAVGGVRDLPLFGVYTLQLPLLLGVLGAALWVFAVANASNFMDGANGLLSGSLLIAFCALGLCAATMQAPSAVVLSLVAAAALVGFIPLNARTSAKVFLGDIGALFLGGLFAVTALIYANAAPLGAVFLCPALIAPILVDVLLTQYARLRRRESLLEAHREHAYQRRIVSGVKHLDVSRGVWLQTLACAGIVLAANALLPILGPAAGVLGLVASITVCAIAYALAPPRPVTASSTTPTPANASAPATPADDRHVVDPSAPVSGPASGVAMPGDARSASTGAAGNGASLILASVHEQHEPRSGQYARATTKSANPINADR